MYVVASGSRRWMTDPNAFVGCGYQWGYINPVADSVLSGLPQGQNLAGPPCP